VLSASWARPDQVIRSFPSHSTNTLQAGGPSFPDASLPPVYLIQFVFFIFPPRLLAWNGHSSFLADPPLRLQVGYQCARLPQLNKDFPTCPPGNAPIVLLDCQNVSSPCSTVFIFRFSRRQPFRCTRPRSDRILAKPSGTKPLVFSFPFPSRLSFDQTRCPISSCRQVRLTFRFFHLTHTPLNLDVHGGQTPIT